MAGRPPLPIQTAGKVRLIAAPTGWRARCSYRDVDGVTRAVERSGGSKAQAQRRLAEAIRDRVHNAGGGELTAETRFAVVHQAWREGLGHLGVGTLRQYDVNAKNYVIPALGGLRLREVTTGRVHDVLQALATNHGVHVAKLSRTVISGVMTHAVTRDLVNRNPVRDAGRLAAAGKGRGTYALDAAQVRQLRTYLSYDDRSQHNGTARLIDFMLATSLRVSEAIAVRWCDVDLAAGTVAVTGSLIKANGVGVIRQDRDSNKLTVRVLSLPAWILPILGPPGEPLSPVCAQLNGKWRQLASTHDQMRHAFDFAGHPQLTSHGLRKSVATLLDGAGLSATDTSMQLGHSRTSTTQDLYVARRGSARAANALAAFAVQ